VVRAVADGVEAASSNRAITPSGRSHGGLSTKINAAVDGRGRPLAILLTPGQAGDAPMRLPLLAHLRVKRTIGRPRTRPDRVLADKAYSSRAIRAHLRTRGIGSVIPEPDDQKAHGKRIGSSGGRPVTYDRTAYRGRNVIARAFNGFKHLTRAGHQIRQARHRLPRRPRPSPPCCSGSPT
jgi:transposase